jgi:excinuclease UvrABC ATPase subunit
MESLGLVTDGMSKTPIDTISGLSPIDLRGPAIRKPQPAIDGGTATEVFNYLRVLFAASRAPPMPEMHQDVPRALKG